MAAVVALLAALGTASAGGAAASNATPGQASAGGFSAEAGASGLSGIAASVTASGVPKVVVAEWVYDFGTALNGFAVKHVFKISNGGNAPLVIAGVQTSCGCTAAQPTKSNLAPGEQSEIAVTFDTRSDKGPATRTITVLTNDPKRPQVLLTLKGDVKVQVGAQPSPIAFGEVKRGTEISRQVTITGLLDDNVLKVGAVTNSSLHLRVAQQPRSDGKPGAILTVTLLKTMPPGPFSDVLKVETSKAPIDVPVFGVITGDLSVNPAQVSFGIVPHSESALRIVRLTNSSDRTVKVVGISSNNLSVTAAVEPIKAGKEYKITLQLRPNTPDGSVHGIVAIKTDDPQQQTVEVPFYGIVGSFRG